MATNSSGTDNSNGADNAAAGGVPGFAGLLFLVLSFFVGFFIWQDRILTSPNGTDAAFSTIGVLALFGLIPFLIVGLAAGVREKEIKTIEKKYKTAVSQLEDASKGFSIIGYEVDRKAIERQINELISLYSQAASVSGRVGNYLLASLGCLIILALAWINAMADADVLARNQANLLALFAVFMSLGAWCIVWPASDERTRRLHPATQIAKLIAKR